MKIAFCCMATGPYKDMLPPLISSIKTHVLPGHVVDVHVFSDMERRSSPAGAILHPFFGGTGYRVTLCKWQCLLEMPGSDYDYIYWIDTDMIVVATVGDEILKPRIAVHHSWFYNQPRDKWPYERNPKSLAYMGPDEGTNYVQGCLFGGESKNLLDMAKTCCEWTDYDQRLGISPISTDSFPVHSVRNL